MRFLGLTLMLVGVFLIIVAWRGRIGQLTAAVK